MYNGFIYIITNEQYPDWVKIGITKNLKRRLQTYQTYSPFRNFKILYSIQYHDCRLGERKIKEMMKYFALDIKNEWYQVDFEIAKVRLDELL